MKQPTNGFGSRLFGASFASLYLALAAPAAAIDGSQASADAPASNLVVFSRSTIAVNWFGTGPVEFSSPLCIGTSTGSYRLTVLPGTGLAQLTAQKELVLALEQDGATIASQSFDGKNAISFTGTTNSANLNCTGGQNARLIVSISEASLTSVSAGQYFDQLRLHLEAI
jgi:hypothetical protein